MHPNLLLILTHFHPHPFSFITCYVCTHTIHYIYTQHPPSESSAVDQLPSTGQLPGPTSIPVDCENDPKLVRLIIYFVVTTRNLHCEGIFQELTN